MVAKMLGILPNCFVSSSKVSRTSGAAFSFTSGLTMAMRHLLICEGITWSQESIPNAAQPGTDTGIPTSLTNSPRQMTKDGRQAGSARWAARCSGGLKSLWRSLMDIDECSNRCHKHLHQNRAILVLSLTTGTCKRDPEYKTGSGKCGQVTS